jgi:putative NADPH-quinone reductase
MRVMLLYAHPLPESFHATLHRTAVEALREAGHEVDDCDLNAEGFNPVLSEAERRDYDDLSRNRAPVADYIARVERAEALVLCFPTWTMGLPAILKGFFDRVMVPGFAFHLDAGKPVRPGLTNIKKLAAIVTYGRPWWMVWYCGDPPRKTVMRYLRWQSAGCPTRYIAQYHMNEATLAQRQGFIARVRREMLAL